VDKAVSNTAAAQLQDAASDPRINHQVRKILRVLNKDSRPFWELPGPQFRATLTGLQENTPLDPSGINITVVMGRGREPL
jgi:acetyl esterase